MLFTHEVEKEIKDIIPRDILNLVINTFTKVFKNTLYKVFANNTSFYGIGMEHFNIFPQ